MPGYTAPCKSHDDHVMPSPRCRALMIAWRNLQLLFLGLLLGLWTVGAFLALQGNEEFLVKELSAQSSLSSVTRLLAIGVVASQSSLRDRVHTVNCTWAEQAKGNLWYFIGDTNVSSELPEDVVVLRGVPDDQYPPQWKVFSMLQYFHAHSLHRYKWFMKADDDLYVRVTRLEALLRSLDHRQPLYLGQPGFGGAEGLTPLVAGGRFCMGGPGIVLSQGLLLRLGPQLAGCLRSAVTSHEDVELGRCIAEQTGVLCTWSLEVGGQGKWWKRVHVRPCLPSLLQLSRLFVHGKKHLDAVVHRGGPFTELITYHPLKTTQEMLAVHRHFMEVESNEALHALDQMHTARNRTVM